MIGPFGRQGPAATLGQHCPQMTQRRCRCFTRTRRKRRKHLSSFARVAGRDKADCVHKMRPRLSSSEYLRNECSKMYRRVVSDIGERIYFLPKSFSLPPRKPSIARVMLQHAAPHGTTPSPLPCLKPPLFLLGPAGARPTFRFNRSSPRLRTHSPRRPANESPQCLHFEFK